MKLFFKLIYVFATATVITSYDTECLKEREGKEEAIDNVGHRSNTPLDHISGDFFLCVWKTTKVMNENGKVDVKNLEKLIAHQLAYVTVVDQPRSVAISKSVRKCDLKPSNVETETAIKVKNCNAKVMSQLYIPIDYD
ncbi:hypothetical protein FQA39_LY04021 [Lamprigera yunnana]|nr:hypothetical protein FQA39_LY04021 [Lamprigera yunnana]